MIETLSLDKAKIVICERLSFGVPLEDIFPENDIHHTIKKLLVQAYFNATRDRFYTIEQVVRNLQGSLHERLMLKEKVVLHLPILDSKISSGALIWVIRHFLGLLPIPIIPRFTNNTTYPWWMLAEVCKSVIKSLNVEAEKHLLRSISDQLRRLPFHNILLTCTLMNFLRSLSAFPRSEKYLDKHSAVFLAKYFTNALFFRPYRPGYFSSRDRHYFPLLLFMIAKWPQIRQKLLRQKSLIKVIAFDEFLNQQSYECKSCIETSTQTWMGEDNLDYLIDTGCQTISDYTTKRRRKKENCCCKYGSHYEHNFELYRTIDYNNTNLILRLEKDTSATSESICSCLETQQGISEKFPEALQQNNIDDALEISSEISSNAEKIYPILENSFCKDDGYIYDDFICKNSGKDFESVSYEEVRNFDPYQKGCDLTSPKIDEESLVEEKTTTNLMAENKNEDNASKSVIEKVSKIGWTYSPKPAQVDGAIPSTPSSKIGWVIPKDNYNICFSSKKEAEAVIDEKDVCEINSLKSDTDEEHEKSKLAPKASKSSQRLAKLKSKLDFGKLLNLKNIKLSKTKSFENMSSNIKYQKLNTSKSSFF